MKVINSFTKFPKKQNHILPMTQNIDQWKILVSKYGIINNRKYNKSQEKRKINIKFLQSKIYLNIENEEKKSELLFMLGKKVKFNFFGGQQSETSLTPIFLVKYMALN